MSRTKRSLKIFSSEDPNTFVPIPVDLPVVPMAPTTIGACTGPVAGIRQLTLEMDAPSTNPSIDIAGVSKWGKRLQQLDGDSVSLYPHTLDKVNHHGDPNADVYAILARPNNAILVVADGCSWGSRPRQAARCAVHGCVDDLNKKLFSDLRAAESTIHDVFRAMVCSLNAAQRLIVQNEGSTTTICMAVVCQLAAPRGGRGGGEEGGRWGLCVLTVGDSPCFVWQKRSGQVYEVTAASHEGKGRDMRDSGGCLGANVGTLPDLENLTCCFAFVSEGDIVFLTTDGVSDNFDPVVLINARDPDDNDSHLPVLTPEQRQEILLKGMSELLATAATRDGNGGLDAFTLKECMISYVIDQTEVKRRYMETMEREIYNATDTTSERKKMTQEMDRTARLLPGKLDHATVVAYQVGLLATPGNSMEV